MCLAVPGKVIAIAEPDGADASPLLRTGTVDFGGVTKEVNMAYVPDAKMGDYVVVHVGFAISVMDENEANQVFEYLRQMDEAGDLAPDRSPTA
ncbi:MAG: HypC/HybG/HupF family hydrogenase formation chaperone [Chthonomonadales bacterium]|nr:HypC/HybG/HupF family hydrogenase formation chaperone [Chthonomonadales bacterium]